MLAKFFMFLLVMALVFMTFKFLREREARLRDRAAGARRKEDAAKVRGSRGKGEKTVTLKKDPKTGIYEPSDD